MPVGPGVGGVGVIASSQQSASLTPQNLLLWSEQLDISGVWQGGGFTVTPNISGTMDEIEITSPGAQAMRQNFTCVPGHVYYWSFEVKLPPSGAVTDLWYSVYDFTSFADIVAPTSYFSMVSTTVARVTFSFTTPPGCTETAVYLTRDTPSSGKFWADKTWVYDGTAKSYVTTTTTIIP